MRNGYMLAALLVTLFILACGGGAPYRKPPSAEQGGLSGRAMSSTPRVLAEEEEWSAVVYVIADGLDGIPGPAGIFSADDVAVLPKSHQAPNGYRWHHHQDVGRMQLVKFEEHRLATPHTGGMAIWGGGYP